MSKPEARVTIEQRLEDLEQRVAKLEGKPDKDVADAARRGFNTLHETKETGGTQ